MTELFATTQHLLEIFGRGGGGGSGGGGGGGGSGGGGSGGGGGIIVLLGYFPTHALGSFMRKKINNPGGLAITIVGTIIYAAGWLFLGSFGVLVALGALAGGPIGYFNVVGVVSNQVRKKANNQLYAAASNDPAWNGLELTTRVTTVFNSFQSDWSSFNDKGLDSYMTPQFAYYNKLMLLALEQRKRRNDVQSPQIIELYPTQIHDNQDDTQDAVVFMVHAKAHDVLLETYDGQEKQLFADDNEFYEYWRFVRSGTTWLLDGIDQATEDSTLRRIDVEAFAQANKMYYSPDWGWLLLPRGGRLFAKGQFGTSDINNHVVGVYNNLLVELYTYTSTKDNTSRGRDSYVIAQVALPKRYDSLIVEAKNTGFSGLFQSTPKGYNKLTLEWPDFNRRYNVYATNVEQVTVFELLHPVYMEKLFALPFKVNIEVADNVVYLYTKSLTADYEVMFNLLKDAFKEMRL